MSLTPDLEALRKAAQAATKGPWERDSFGVCGGYMASAEICVVSRQMPHDIQVKNLEFIALANPATILALLAQLEAALAWQVTFGPNDPPIVYEPPPPLDWFESAQG